MVKNTCAALAVAVFLPISAFGQTIKIPDRIEKLAAAAGDNVNITLDGPLLQLAGQFLNGKNGNEAEVKNIVSKLRGIQVRSFEFKREHEYSDADIAELRTQLKAPWARVIETREKNEHVEIFIRMEKEGGLGGLVIISAEPRELTIVNIDGAIDLKQLSTLGGKFGIPNFPAAAAPKPSGTAKDSAE